MLKSFVIEDELTIQDAAPYMIVVASLLDEKVIGLALRHIDHAGELEACTMPLNTERP